MSQEHKPPESTGPSRRTLLAELRILEIALAVLVGLFLAGGAIVWQIHKDELRRTALREEAMKPPTGFIGGPFTLTDQDGKKVSDTDFRGKYMLVYFGYTYCPDLCPTGLSSIAHVLDTLGPDAKKLQAIFITVDPARDTTAKLKTYVSSFHPDILGLTGTSEQIDAVAKEYKVYYAKGAMVDDKDYIMDHSSLIYLMGPRGNFITTFPDDSDPNDMAKAVRDFMGGKDANKAAK